MAIPARRDTRKGPSRKPVTAGRLDATIARAKRELEHMIDLNPQVMLLVDRNGSIVRANRALLAQLGAKVFGEVIGRRMDQVFRTSDPVFFNHLLNDRSEAADAREAECELPNGSVRTFRFSGVSSSPDAEVCVVLAEDVTTSREQAARLEKQHKKDAVTTLVGALMHAINQPLTVITVKAQLIHMDIEKGLIQPAELSRNVRDIMKLAIQISDILQSVERPRDFVTEPYVGTEEILDLQKSGSAPGQGSRLDAVDAILDVLGTHDPTASLHSRRTAEYAVILARALGLGAIDQETARRSALLHDIGKIGIPDPILQKPTQFTAAEMAVMRAHSGIGHRILSSFPRLIDESEAARSHHERWDGTGYPRGLAGEEIPLMARIVAVTDTFDTLRHGRSYKKPSSLEVTVAQIRLGKGTQFDPTVVEAFDRSVGEFDTVPVD